MSVRPLCVEPHGVLRQPAAPITRWTDETRRLARDLIETMYANDGIGLAAPQIGCSTQMFVANPSQQQGQELVVINPVVEAAEGRASVIEGCLSLPDVWDRVRRAARIRISGRDVNGEPLTIRAEGLLAIVCQHEVDHLHGQLFIDRLSWFRRRRLQMRFTARSRKNRSASSAQ